MARHRMVEGSTDSARCAGGRAGAARDGRGRSRRINETSEYWRPLAPRPAASPTIRGGSTSSARRSCSRRSATRPAARWLPPHHLAAGDARGIRNWDYRYSWIRDATFTLWSLHVLGPRRRGGGLRPLHRATSAPSTAPAPDHVRHRRRARAHRIDARPPLRLRGRPPVRIGNGAYDQRQNDVYGALIDSVYIHAKITAEPTPDLADRRGPDRRRARAWREPDQGIWESRGEPSTTCTPS